MKSLLLELENNEAILLMYMADELPTSDRLEVEQMLASDPTLRAELDILRQTQQLAFDSLQTLDSVSRPAAPPIMALGQTSRLIRQWTERRRRPEPTVTVIRRPMPWRRISVAFAAALLVGYYIWAVYQPLTPLHRAPRSGFGTPYAEETNPLNPDDISPLPQSRELSAQEKIALLANSLEDSASDEASNLHVAEVAAVVPADNSDQNATGEP
ncbi:MAG TPA: hypothetical protein VGG44_06845 [Tepidisphaeraceae bacterium]|jgi:hypothetical protein